MIIPIILAISFICVAAFCAYYITEAIDDARDRRIEERSEQARRTEEHRERLRRQVQDSHQNRVQEMAESTVKQKRKKINSEPKNDEVRRLKFQLEELSQNQNKTDNIKNGEKKNVGTHKD